MSNVTKQFVLAGKATFTVELPEEFRTKNSLKPHYTFRVEHKAANGQYKEAWFVKYLTGSDNTRDYSYVGVLNAETGQVRTTSKSKLQDNSLVFKLLNRTLALIWLEDVSPMESQGFGLHHEGRCGKCGRLLTTPESVQRGIGPECWVQLNGGNYPHLAVQAELADEEASRIADQQEGESEERLPYWHEDADGEYEADIAERQAVANAYRRLANGDLP